MSSGKIDTLELKSRVDIVDVIRSCVPLVKRGAEWAAPCPFHGGEDRNFYVSPNKQIWACFSHLCHECDEGNDVIGFVRKFHGLSFQAACEKLGAQNEWKPKPAIPFEPRAPDPERTTSKPPADAESALPPMATHQLGEPQQRRAFRDLDGALLGFECRYARDEDGKSPSRMWTWGARPGEVPAWGCGAFSRPRHLYGLDRVGKRHYDPIAIFEGPKKADSGANLLPSHVCISWSGGAGSWHTHDWQPIAGRDCLIWPDADEPGREAAGELAAHLHGLGCEVRYLDVSDVEHVGFDISDMEADGMDSAAVIEWARQRAKDYTPPPAAREEPASLTQALAELPPIGVYAEDPPPARFIEPTAPAKVVVTWPAGLDLKDLAGREPEPPKFIISDWLPVGYATLLAGHGGVGKSGIALHLSACIASGEPFFGLNVSRRRVLYLSCEDRESVLEWRLKRLSAYSGIDLASLGEWLQILPLVGHNTVLWDRDPRTGYTNTPAIADLEEQIRRHGSELVVVDGISDTFAGNENARTEVKRYVNALVSLIPPESGAVLLVGHISKPSASGGATSEGYSGSTGWHNAVRARWYLFPETEAADDGERPSRTGSLVLELQKSNLGRMNQEMRFTWDDDGHLFAGKLTSGASEFDRKHQDREEQRAILLAFKGCAEAAVTVPSAVQGPRTTHHILSLRPEFPASLKGSGGAKKKRFRRQIEELRQLHAIEEAEYRRDNRHSGRELRITSEGMRQCA